MRSKIAVSRSNIDHRMATGLGNGLAISAKLGTGWQVSAKHDWMHWGLIGIELRRGGRKDLNISKLT
jgi:hypothetical protein